MESHLFVRMQKYTHCNPGMHFPINHGRQSQRLYPVRHSCLRLDQWKKSNDQMQMFLVAS